MAYSLGLLPAESFDKTVEEYLNNMECNITECSQLIDFHGVR
jgi:hypothetical protein